MSVSQKIVPHLPYLRRFARALTGSQAGGDGYVVEALETLVADPAAIEGVDADPRVALYRLFLKIWNGLPANTEAPASGEGGEKRLGMLAPLRREAFLLTAMEGFSPERAAMAMDLDQPAFDALAEEAAREIAEQVATDILIIEDEPIISMDLEAMVAELGHRVIAIAATHRQALEAARKTRPGLILADIQLADGSSGLDAVNEILAEFETPVIFVTAFPERFLTGERPEPAFLLSKPFSANALVGLISQALFFDEKSRLKTLAA